MVTIPPPVSAHAPPATSQSSTSSGVIPPDKVSCQSRRPLGHRDIW